MKRAAEMASAHRPIVRPIALACAMASLQIFATGVRAAEIDTGNPDLTVRWDTTVKYSVAARLKSADPAYTSAVNANGDDGDRNFNKGVVSNRLDLFTEMDAVWQQRAGVRVSGAAYYDTVYGRKNDNPGFAGGSFPNNLSVPYNEFTSDTRKWMGRNAEVLDAFVFGKFDMGNTTATIRVGQHALVWGESLFFGGNAIAGGMMPVDAIKLSSVPATQFKEAIRPVPMVSGTVQVTPQLSLGAYYQVRWRKSILPPAGSFLSNADFLDYGGEQLLLGPAGAAVRLSDRKPSDSGQGGIQLRFRGEQTDYGAYLVRYHEKGPQGVPVLGVIPGIGPIPTGYYLAYNQGVTALALSASRTFDLFNVTVEAGIRRNSSLASTQGADASALAPPGVIAPTDVTGNPGYATGRTAHINLSTMATLPANLLWREANLLGEIAWNRALSITKNAAAADPNSTRDGVALRVVLEPTYRSVAPGVDISVPVGVGWAPKGSRPRAAGGPPAWIPENGGDVSIGVNGSWRDAWRFTLSYTHYYGSKAPVTVDNRYTWQQSLGDRDFIAASLRYSY